MLTTILSIIEERRMLKKTGGKYFTYIQTTGFYTPLRLHRFKSYTQKDTMHYMIQSILKMIISSIIFVSIGIIAFIFSQTTLVRLPPPRISWDYLISAEYLQHLQFAECVPFFLFLICILGIGVYSLLNTLKKRKKTE